MDNYIVVGLSGATNSGKTTLSNKLKKVFPEVAVINMDDYFVEEGSKCLKMIPEVNHANWEDLSAVDFARLHKDTLQWIEKQKNKTSNGQPAVLVIEGIIIFNYKPLAPVFHKKYFITLCKEKCWDRRQLRHYVPADPPGYFDLVVWPMYLKNMEELAHDKHIEYLDGNEDADVLYEKVHKGMLALLSP